MWVGVSPRADRAGSGQHGRGVGWGGRQNAMEGSPLCPHSAPLTRAAQCTAVPSRPACQQLSQTCRRPPTPMRLPCVAMGTSGTVVKNQAGSGGKKGWSRGDSGIRRPVRCPGTFAIGAWGLAVNFSGAAMRPTLTHRLVWCNFVHLRLCPSDKGHPAILWLLSESSVRVPIVTSNPSHTQQHCNLVHISITPMAYGLCSHPASGNGIFDQLF